ncbi:unnamed protein product [Symbiodinium pilosum]|uniref:Uncharacterized protein n=1 Tax=Symbiodinium pilosum TaxID=2952 RepID=A0A812LA62_SYMPI|nr:unnamed protein product [Symbiodinium pilosum]
MPSPAMRRAYCRSFVRRMRSLPFRLIWRIPASRTSGRAEWKRTEICSLSMNLLWSSPNGSM